MSNYQLSDHCHYQYFIIGRALDLTSNDESDLTKSVEAVLNSDAFIKSIDQLTDDKIHRITETGKSTSIIDM